MSATRVLLVGANAALSGAPAALAAAGYAVRVEGDSLAGLIAVEEWQPALVILDWAMPFLSGERFVTVLQAGLASPPLVIALHDGEVTGFGQPVGVAAALPKPPNLDLTQLVETVARLLADDARPA